MHLTRLPFHETIASFSAASEQTGAETGYIAWNAWKNAGVGSDI
jgi:hypothetical protein